MPAVSIGSRSLLNVGQRQHENRNRRLGGGVASSLMLSPSAHDEAHGLALPLFCAPPHSPHPTVLPSLPAPFESAPGTYKAKTHEPCESRRYTEMVSLGAVLNNPREVLAYNVEEHPITVQLGGSNPAGLARAARVCQEYGYDEINLNVCTTQPTTARALCASRGSH